MDLFAPLRLGELELSHRVVLAPLTRCRAEEPSLAPGLAAAGDSGAADDAAGGDSAGFSVSAHAGGNVPRYYAQRATPGGLLITEATHVSPESFSTPGTPGIWTDAQQVGWKRVVDAVHENGGLISCQLWHCGRIAHAKFAEEHPLIGKDDEYSRARRPGRSAGDVMPLHPRDSTKAMKTITYGGLVDFGQPQPLRTDEIPRLIDDYVAAARRCKSAGFDAVEIHAAHGYLIDQFINTNTNTRADKYGPQSVENRCRLLFAVVRAVVGEFGPGRVGVRLSPFDVESKFRYYGTSSDDPVAVYSHAVRGLNDFDLAYVLLTEPRWTGSAKTDSNAATDPGHRMAVTNGPLYRGLSRHKVMGAGGFTPNSAREAVEHGIYDAIAFGRWFISNPDLVERLRKGQALNVYDRGTFYTNDDIGYTDYPRFEELTAETKTMEQHQIGASLATAKL